MKCENIYYEGFVNNKSVIIKTNQRFKGASPLLVHLLISKLQKLAEFQIWEASASAARRASATMDSVTGNGSL
jgi:hypothetical protein